MAEKAQTSSDIAEQAVHDRSVIDHVLHSFSAGADRVTFASAPARENSAQVYHSIRRVWPDQLVTRPAAFQPLFD